jgi:O-antigen/teichoic acid export membrane protein
METIKNLFYHLKHPPRHLVVASSAWISRIITALIGIISVRTLLLYLGEERYAVYAIVYSLSGWFALCDFGIAAALQNFISECRARNESYQKYIRAALQIALILIFCFAAVMFLISPFAQEKLLSKFTNISEVKNTNILLIVGYILILSAFTNIAYRAYYAFQKGYVSNILPAIASIIAMCLIVLCNAYFPIRENILTALLIFTLPQLCAAFILSAKIFGSEIKNIFKVNRVIVKELIIRALKFGGSSIMGALTIQMDYIIMSQTLNSIDIATYNILNKFFSLFLFIHAAILSAAWPVFNELFNSGKLSIIKNMVFKYILFGFCIIISGTILMYLFADNIIMFLAPNTPIYACTYLFFLFGIYYLLRIWSDTFALFLQSINILQIIWIVSPIQAVISCLAQYWFSLKYGIGGILTGLILSFLFSSCLILPYKMKQLFKSKIEEK